jgi:hypothetical protein
VCVFICFFVLLTVSILPLASPASCLVAGATAIQLCQDRHKSVDPGLPNTQSATLRIGEPDTPAGGQARSLTMRAGDPDVPGGPGAVQRAGVPDTPPAGVIAASIQLGHTGEISAARDPDLPVDGTMRIGLWLAVQNSMLAAGGNPIAGMPVTILARLCCQGSLEVAGLGIVSHGSTGSLRDRRNGFPAKAAQP